MLTNINQLIFDIYKKAFYGDLLSLRNFISESINSFVTYDTISWTLQDTNGNDISTIRSPIISENFYNSNHLKILTSAINLMNKHIIKYNNLNFKINSVSDFRLIEEVVDKINLLTSKEATISKLMSTGLSNKLIAEQLKLSPSTVNNHLTNIYSKIGVNSRTEAVRELKHYE